MLSFQQKSPTGVPMGLDNSFSGHQRISLLRVFRAGKMVVVHSVHWAAK
jgi:hypothetical protein